MKKCIWCSRTENHVPFYNDAHTFPQSLGGKNICENVCDLCNKYFGDKENKLPAVEIALKEVLNLSKYLLLDQTSDKIKGRFKSEYFDFNPKLRTLKFKMKYSLKKNFQSEFARRFRRGIYKVFLEERERLMKDAHDSRFDFIRTFARYNLSDYPIFYLKPKFPILLYSKPDIINPEIRFTNYTEQIDKEYRFFYYQILGHHIVIPTTSILLNERLKIYKEFLFKDDSPFGKELIEIKYIEDLDFRFSFMANR